MFLFIFCINCVLKKEKRRRRKDLGIDIDCCILIFFERLLNINISILTYFSLIRILISRKVFLSSLQLHKVSRRTILILY